MFIFTLILFQSFTISWPQRTYHCDRNSAYDNYISCLNKWRVVRENSRGHSMFLKDVTLIDDMCIMPGSPTVEEMGKCVTDAVSPVCDSILTHWKGMREFTSYLCKYREAFEGKYARCRKNLGFQSDYENCMSSNVQAINSGKDECRSYTELQRCLKRSLRKHCSDRATEFFSLAFHARDAPIIAYSCKQANHMVKDYVFGIQTDSGSNVKDEGSNHGNPETDPPASDSYFRAFEGNNLEVDASNKSNTAFLNVLTLSTLLLRFL